MTLNLFSLADREVMLLGLSGFYPADFLSCWLFAVGVSAGFEAVSLVVE